METFLLIVSGAVLLASTLQSFAITNLTKRAIEIHHLLLMVLYYQKIAVSELETSPQKSDNGSPKQD